MRMTDTALINQNNSKHDEDVGYIQCKNIHKFTVTKILCSWKTDKWNRTVNIEPQFWLNWSEIK